MKRLTFRFHRSGQIRFRKQMPIITVPVLFIIVLFTFSCTRIINDFLVSTIAEYRHDAEDYIYFLDENEKLIPLKNSRETIQQIPYDQVTFFLHGMGPYPDKGAKFEEFSTLALNFGRPVYAIIWPSFIDFVTIPRGDALHTGEVFLGEFFDLILKWKKTSKGKAHLVVH